MRTEQAIKLLSKYQKDIMPLTKRVIPGLLDALSLGIEALKRCQHNYLNPQRADFRRLPGETEE